MPDEASRSLGLAGLRVTGVVEGDGDTLDLEVESVARTGRCPYCPGTKLVIPPDEPVCGRRHHGGKLPKLAGRVGDRRRDGLGAASKNDGRQPRSRRRVTRRPTDQSAAREHTARCDPTRIEARLHQV